MQTTACNRWWRVAALVAVIALAPAAGWAQVTADPNDTIYLDLDRWQQQGYLEPLPSLRPYPTQLVIAALREVTDRAGPVDAALARSYLDSLQGGLLTVPVHAAAGYELQDKQGATLNRLGAQVDASGLMGDLLGYSLRGRLVTEAATGAEVFPRWEDTYEATLATEAATPGTRSSLPISLGGVPFSGYGVLNGMVSFGTDRLWIQGGLVRSSFGPVLESPILGPQAPQAGHFSATYRGSWFTYTTMVGELVAYYTVGRDGVVKLISSGSATTYPQKYLFLQSISLSPWPWVQADIIQTVVTGGRFSPTYLLPFPLYVQAYLGDWDNSLAGGYLQLNLPFGIRPSFLLYIDDLDLKKLLQLNFDSNGNKVALQGGLSWAPPLAVPAQLSLTYLAITPYMYTHFAYEALNYLQYTNYGQQLGSILPPNSDQWTLRAEVIPLPWLRLDLWGKLIRHGNGSDYGQGTVSGDGSVYDDGTIQTNGVATFLSHGSFLNQPVLEQVQQIGIAGTGDLSYAGLRGRLSVSYTLEAVQHRDLNASAPDELNNILGVNFSVGF